MRIKSTIKKHAQYPELVTQRKRHQVEGSWYQRHWTVWAYTWGLAPYQRCDLHANCSMLEGTSQALNSAFDLKNSITWKIRAICRGLLTNRVSQGSPILLPLQGSPTKGRRLRSSVWTCSQPCTFHHMQCMFICVQFLRWWQLLAISLSHTNETSVNE